MHIQSPKILCLFKLVHWPRTLCWAVNPSARDRLRCLVTSPPCRCSFSFVILPYSLHPPVLWAQRADSLYITISLGDVKDKVLDLKDGSLLFR